MVILNERSARSRASRPMSFIAHSLPYTASHNTSGVEGIGARSVEILEILVVLLVVG